MKIIEANIYALRIPFTETFSHSARARTFSDSIIVRLKAEDGTVGYGEGVARPYVTGETIETSIAHIERVLWPSIAGKEFPQIVPASDPIKALSAIDEALDSYQATTTDGVIAWHAARSAVEIALIDCTLRAQKLSLSQILPPRVPFVTYSCVITSGSLARALQHAKYFKLFGARYVKIKISDPTEARERVSAIRAALGPSISLRVDANCAYAEEEAISVLKELAPFKIESAEQPLPRCEPHKLAQVRQHSPVPLMVDESLVTRRDAVSLIESKACDYFNLRISKCGGIVPTLRLARLANDAGIKMQLGCHVGETAILSAAGRHVAAYLGDHLSFVEGSYGKLLLTEDVSRNSINFGHGGRAPVLKNGFGLGIEVREEILHKYARTSLTLRED